VTLETFLLERMQTLYENTVEINLTESGVKPMTLRSFLTAAEREEVLDLSQGYGHTDGTPALRKAIAGLYPGATSDNILVGAGSAEANFVAAWTLFGEGGPERTKAAAMLPNYTQIHGIAKSLGAELTPFSLSSDRGWALDVDGLQRAVGPDTKVILICNPNNPTGHVLTEAEMAAVVDVARKAGAWILSDEIYRGAELGGRPETSSFWGRYDKVIVTGSVSKALAFSGLRLGWLVASGDFAKEARRRQDYTTIGTTPISQYVATRVLEPKRRRQLLERSRVILERNLAIVGDWVARNGNRLSWQPPEAGGVAFVRYDFSIGSEQLSTLLRERESTFIVAGAWFGLEGHVRIGIGGDSHELQEGLQRIDRLLATL
jgi:hypothetical protein